MTRRRAFLFFAAAILILDPAAAFLYYHLTRPAIEARRFRPTTSPGPLDAGIVFCEGIGTQHGLSETTGKRLEFAAELLRAGRIRHAAGLGGNWGNIRGGEGMRAILTEAGVSPERAHGESRSYDTLTNVDAFRAMLRENRWREVVIISSPIHLARILYLLQRNPPVESAATRIRVLPYSPHAGPAKILDHWREIHHEWIAWSMMAALPRPWFRAMMRAKRK